MSRKLIKLHPEAALYHWAPAHLRDVIRKEGLRTAMGRSDAPVFNTDGTEWKAPWLCFGVTPLDAYLWAGLKPGQYDLYQIHRDSSDKVRSRRDGGKHIIEVRIHNDIPSERVFYMGSLLQITRPKRRKPVENL